MYYYIRENFARDKYHHDHQQDEGFCSKLTFKSELLDGQVYLDGYDTYKLTAGDRFSVDTH